jgi:hypothetical protein
MAAVEAEVETLRQRNSTLHPGDDEEDEEGAVAALPDEAAETVAPAASGHSPAERGPSSAVDDDKLIDLEYRSVKQLQVRNNTRKRGVACHGTKRASAAACSSSRCASRCTGSGSVMCTAQASYQIVDLLACDRIIA